MKQDNPYKYNVFESLVNDLCKMGGALAFTIVAIHANVHVVFFETLSGLLVGAVLGMRLAKLIQYQKYQLFLKRQQQNLVVGKKA